MNTASHGPKLQKRLRAFLLAQQRGYGRLRTFLELQRRSLEAGEYGDFILRCAAEEPIMAELTALDRVIRPLETQLRRSHGAPVFLPDREEPSLDELRGTVESARRAALEANRLCQAVLCGVTQQLKQGLPARKRVSRFAGGDPGRPPRFIDISA